MTVAIQLPSWTLVDLDYAKAWASANMENTPEDDLLHILLASATEAIEREIHRQVIDRGLRTERITIGRLTEADLWVLNPPIIAVNAVYEDVNRVFDANSQIPSADLLIDPTRGKITYVTQGGSTPTYWTTGLEVVQVEYWGGYATRDDVPWDLRGYCMETVADTYYHLTRKQFATTSISDEQGNRVFMKSAVIPAHVREKLNRDYKLKWYTRQISQSVDVNASLTPPTQTPSEPPAASEEVTTVQVPSAVIPVTEGILLDGSVYLDAAEKYDVWYNVINIDSAVSVVVTLGVDDGGAQDALTGSEFWMTGEVIPARGMTGWRYGGEIDGADDIRGSAGTAGDAVIWFKVVKI